MITRVNRAGQGFSFKVLIINTHKGFAAFNRRFILLELREAVRTVSPDVVFLQEVLGAYNEKHAKRFENWPVGRNMNFLPKSIWEDSPTAATRSIPDGDHGNALLSRFPIRRYQNVDISVAGEEKRGSTRCPATHRWW